MIFIQIYNLKNELITYFDIEESFSVHDYRDEDYFEVRNKINKVVFTGNSEEYYYKIDKINDFYID